jgi:hypothetical protein
MTETADKNFKAQTQKQRWVLYGGNVLLSSAVVIVLAGLLIYLGQAGNRRFDMTASGRFSLNPQTLNLIGNLNSKVRLISLYSAKTNRTNQADYCQAVADLLQEYQRKGRNIDVDFIDPLTNLSKKDALIAEVANAYGGEVKKYREFLDGYGADYDKIKTISQAEADRVAKLPVGEVKSDELAMTLATVLETVRSFPAALDDQKQGIDRELKQKSPDYRKAVDQISDAMQILSGNLAAIEQKLKTLDTSQMPSAIKAYFAEAPPRFEELKKLADGLATRAQGLGELKLDTVRQSLQDDSILVMGAHDLRVIGFDKVWSIDPRLAKAAASETGTNQPARPSFAGEQQVTTAIFALTQNGKQKVVFVRPGGGPLTEPGLLGLSDAGGGPFSDIAERLRSYNFDVQEKDLSGTYAMEAQMRGMPVAPEPSDAELKDAIWVVLGYTVQPREGMPAPPSIAAKLAEHLKEGGSALVLPANDERTIDAPLAQWGINVASDAIAVHEAPPESDVAAKTMIDRIRRVPYIFDIRDFGDHPIVRPLRSLPSLLLPILPVTAGKPTVDGVSVTPIIPVPTAPQALLSWGKRNPGKLDTQPKFEPAVDIPGPFFAGAAAERIGGGRLVVLAAFTGFMNEVLEIPDEDLQQRGQIVAAFPANAELFCNSVFWLAHQDSMLAISPAAMEVSRVADMSDRTQLLWSIVALGGLPAAVVALGLGVYFVRRD